MKIIKVKINAKFRDNTQEAVKGKQVVIDGIKSHPSCQSGLMIRVTNLWKKPQWWDAEWFDFDGGKK